MDWFELIDSWKWGEGLKGGERKTHGRGLRQKKTKEIKAGRERG